MNLNSSTPCAPSFSPYRPPLEKEAAFWLKYFFLPRDLFQFSQGDMGGGVGFVPSRGGESILIEEEKKSVWARMLSPPLDGARMLSPPLDGAVKRRGNHSSPHTFLFFFNFEFHLFFLVTGVQGSSLRFV